MMCNTCPALARRNEELEAELAQLKFEVYGHGYEAPPEFGLTGGQERLVGALLAGERTKPEWFLFEATRSIKRGCAEPGASNLIHTMISHIRAKFKPFGLEIETVWGRGYRLTPESRERLNNWTPPKQRSAEAA